MTGSKSFEMSGTTKTFLINIPVSGIPRDPFFTSPPSSFLLFNTAIEYLPPLAAFLQDDAMDSAPESAVSQFFRVHQDRQGPFRASAPNISACTSNPVDIHLPLFDSIVRYKSCRRAAQVRRPVPQRVVSNQREINKKQPPAPHPPLGGADDQARVADDVEHGFSLCRTRRQKAFAHFSSPLCSEDRATDGLRCSTFLACPRFPIWSLHVRSEPLRSLGDTASSF